MTDIDDELEFEDDDDDDDTSLHEGEDGFSCDDCNQWINDGEGSIIVMGLGDIQEFCSWQCIINHGTLGAVDPSCLERAGNVAAMHSYNERITAIMAKAPDSVG